MTTDDDMAADDDTTLQRSLAIAALCGIGGARIEWRGERQQVVFNPIRGDLREQVFDPFWYYRDAARFLENVIAGLSGSEMLLSLRVLPRGACRGVIDLGGRHIYASVSDRMPDLLSRLLWRATGIEG